MRLSKSVYLLMTIVLLAGLLPLTVAAQPAAPIEADLLTRLQAEGSASYFVKMTVDADLSAAYGIQDWNARGQFVVDALTQVAHTTQAPVIAYCQKHGLEFKSFLTGNSVYVRGGNLAAAQELAALPGVAYLALERVRQIPDPTGGASINGFTTEGVSPNAATDWGLTDTKALQVWALGVRGQGIKVANIDTGVQYNHPALLPNYGCPANPTDAKCWYDPSNSCAGTVCDNNGHGTHTMGTMAAKDDPSLAYIAGMAPDATWIACKGCESSSCSDSSLNACADWLLQPGGNVANRPNVVNNSWGGGGGDTWYQAKVQAWQAAGIFPAFSAGNSGSGCSTLGSPGDYQESFASAAHDSSRAIASFSSRGPSTFGHDPYTKPNIAAPGVSICSTVPTNSWSCGYSGTSMASPHTAGAVALLWQACPALVGQMDLTFQTLQNYADVPPAGNCGAPPDVQGNYTFGYGYLNALTAVQSCMGGLQFGTLQGTVKDQGGQPISGATVSAAPGIQGGSVHATTDPNGFYTMQLVPGTYTATATKTGYTSQSVGGIVIVADQTTNQNFSLTYIGAWVSYGTLCFDWTRFDGEYFPGTAKTYFLGGRGGADGTVTYGNIYSFDPATGACADTGALMPYPISNYTIVALNDGSADLLCTFGGRDSTGVMILKVQCYNPATNAVALKADLPATFSTFLPGGAAAVANKAYIFGGFRNTASPYHTTVTWEYDPVANTYTQKGDMALGRGYMDVAVVDGKIYAFGGDVYDGANLVAQAKTEVFDPALVTWNDAAVAELATATGEGRAYGFDAGSNYALKGKVVIAGGGQWPAESLDVLTYGVAPNTYDTSFPDLNTARRDQAGFFVPGNPGRMWVVGGRSGSDLPPYAPAEYFDVPTLPANTMHVGSVLLTKSGTGPYTLTGKGKIHNTTHVPLAGVTVTAQWLLPDGTKLLRNFTSGSAGGYQFALANRTQVGTYRFCVVQLVKAGYTYVKADNDVTPPCKVIAVP